MGHFSRKWMFERGHCQSGWTPSLWSKSNTPTRGTDLSVYIICGSLPHSEFFVLSEMLSVLCTLFACFSLSQGTFCLSWVAGGISYLSTQTRLFWNYQQGLIFTSCFLPVSDSWWTHYLHLVSCKTHECQMGSHQPCAEPWQTVPWTQDEILM